MEHVLGTEDEVAVALVSLLAFMRIGTHPTVFERPMTVEEATRVVSGWLARPNVGVAQPTRRHLEVLAALAVEHRATLCTTDRDFSWFPRLRSIDPLAD